MYAFEKKNNNYDSYLGQFVKTKIEHLHNRYFAEFSESTLENLIEKQSNDQTQKYSLFYIILVPYMIMAKF